MPPIIELENGTKILPDTEAEDTSSSTLVIANTGEHTDYIVLLDDLIRIDGDPMLDTSWITFTDIGITNNIQTY